MGFRRYRRRARRRTRIRRRRYGYRRRRFGSRRVRIWRRRGVVSQRTIRFNNAIVPDATYARLVYRKAGTLTISDSALDTNSGLFNVAWANDPFDPDPNLGNDSAQGFDYFRDYYQHYIVTRAKIRVDFTNLGSGQAGNIWGTTAYVLPQLGGTVPLVVTTTPVQFLQNLPRIKWKTMSCVSAGRQRTSIRHEWTIKKDVAGLLRGNYWEETNWSANTTSSPSVRRPIYLGLGTANGGANAAGLALNAQYKITVVYYCRFYSRKVTPELEDPE